MCVCGVIEVSFELPPFSPSCPRVCPYSYYTSELQQDRRPQKSGSKQCLPPFVSRLPFFFCPPSQSTGLLCIDFPHSAARQPLSAVFCPFLYATSPAEPSIPLLTFLWHSQQCENAAHLLTGCNSLKTHN